MNMLKAFQSVIFKIYNLSKPDKFVQLTEMVFISDDDMIY